LRTKIKDRQAIASKIKDRQAIASVEIEDRRLRTGKLELTAASVGAC
jgi:hypothetical protein